MRTLQATRRLQQRKQTFKNRLRIMMGLVIVMVAIAGANLFNLQITKAGHYATLSDENRLRLVAVAPPRGAIYDRDNRPIALNRAVYQLEIVPALIDDMEKTVAELGEVVELDESDLRDFRRSLRELPPSRNLVLKRMLSDVELARFAAEQYRFLGAEVTAKLRRYYPDEGLFAHAVGYIGRIDKKDLSRIDKRKYRASQYIGKVGIERRYEELLRGTIGLRRIEINAQGRVIRVINEKGARPGKDLMLTLDHDLQKAARDALGDQLGSVVALDPRNGEVLALVSQPSYDPNWFSRATDGFDYRRMADDPRRLFFNRALKGQYPPGSIVKPIIALAGLERQTVSPDMYLYAGPYYITPDFTRRFYDWRDEGHGLVNLHTSIAQSCDVFFYDLAYRTGIDQLSVMLKKFGLGEATRIDLHGEAAGLVPSRQWKKERHRQNWLPEETVMTGVGQAYTLATPLQLALATAMMANRGSMVRPRLLKATRETINQRWVEEKAAVERRIAIKERHWDIIGDAMMDVVHSPNGTAHNISRGAAYLMAGKTGTAQVTSRKQGEKRKKDQEKIPKSLRDHALFVVYAPVENPSIAMAVVVENVGSGSRHAAPIARRVLDVYFSRKTGDDVADI